MAGEIKHEWNGTVLTVTSDTGTSSSDLQGPRGPQGVRGPQGPSGVIYDEYDRIIVDLEPYYMKDEVDGLIDGLADEYATQNFVITEVAKAQMEGASIDTSGFATKDDLKNYATNSALAAKTTLVDDFTIQRRTDGTIYTTIGGGILNTALASKFPNTNTDGANYNSGTITLRSSDNNLVTGTDVLGFKIVFEDGTVDTLVGYAPNVTLYDDSTWTFQPHAKNCTYVDSMSYYSWSNGSARGQSFSIKFSNAEYKQLVIKEISIGLNGVPTSNEYVPIDANFIPVDGISIVVADGKLSALAGGSIDLANYATKTYVDNAVANVSGNANILYGTADKIAGVSTLPAGTLYCVIEG